MKICLKTIYIVFFASTSVLLACNFFKNSNDLSFEEIPDSIHLRAENFLNQMKNSTMAPIWNDETYLIERVRTIYRPDIDGAAYYEFNVSDGGFIIVSVTETDYPIPHWSFEGSCPTDYLLEQKVDRGEEVNKFYKLDSLSYVAENESGELIAQAGNLPLRVDETMIQSQESDLESDDIRIDESLQPWENWETLKNGYAREYNTYIENTRYESTNAWGEEQLMEEMRGRAPSGNPNLYVPRAWWANGANYLRYNIAYRQIKKSNGCLTGCAATAWVMLLAHADYMDKNNNYSYRCGENLFPGTPPKYVEKGNGAFMTTLGISSSFLGTNCWFNGAGWVTPWSMDNITNYLKTKVYYYFKDDYSFPWGYRDFLAKEARDVIKIYKRPVVIGTGYYAHYPVAIGYGEYGSRKYFFVNNGWGGGGNGWVPMETWYYGTFKTSGCR